MVNQQAQRWLRAGVFEAMAADLRAISRLVAGRAEQPTAAVLDSRTLQSSPESGARAGYDGHKRRKGSKVHAAVDTLGHLLALPVSAASEQDRAQVAALAAAVQQETGQNVQLAYVDQGYTGAEAAQDAHDHGITLEVAEAARSPAWLRPSAPAMGGGEEFRLGRALSPLGPRLRAAADDLGGLTLLSFRLPYAPPIRSPAPKCMTGSKMIVKRRQLGYLAPI